MTVTQINLRNFKCFQALDLPCAPLTLLTGHNAGGKSTVLQGLLLLAQSVREAGNSDLLPLNGALVELGAASDVIPPLRVASGPFVRCDECSRTSNLALCSRQRSLGSGIDTADWGKAR